MHRTGIPASITLAQGLLESGIGNSRLARHANNHFGIKCHKGWTGNSYYIEDDDYDKQGNLMKSCFRSYSNAEESYFDHSRFLSERSRYRFLFDYDRTDYKAWAKGLKKAGYATAPTYATKLIKIIERENLQRFDLMNPIDVVIVTTPPPAIDPPKPTVPAPTPVPSKPTVDIPEYEEIPVPSQPDNGAVFNPIQEDVKDKVFQNNSVKAIYARRGDSPLSIAQRFGKPLKRVLKFNDLPLGSREVFEDRDIVYLQLKRRATRNKHVTAHKVKAGETLYDIAQLYGIRIKKLRKRNGIPKRHEPLVGEVVILRGKAKLKPKYARAGFLAPIGSGATKPISAPSSTPSKPVPSAPSPSRPTPSEPTTQPAPPPVSVPTPTPIKPPVATPNQPAPSQPPVYAPPSQQPSAPQYYYVVSGDTLYAISRRFNMSVDDLKLLNGLNSNTLSIGQRLRVK